MKKSIFLSIIVLVTCISLIGCSTGKNTNASNVGYDPDSLSSERDVENDADLEVETDDEEIVPADMEDALEEEDTKEEVFINPDGNTLATRINSPKDYMRTEEGEQSFTSFMRNHTLKKDGSPLLLYNGEEKSNQSDHVAVFDISLGEKDLQQCADSIMRVYAEYYWSMEEYDKIAFHLTNNFLMEYSKWREGYRLKVNGNDTSMVKSAGLDDSYKTFLLYMERVFMFAGTLSLDSECKEISLDQIQPGDMFIKGGSPGHCVLVVDMVENAEGEKAFLLAQGYMPAQDFHVLKNPLHEEDPWYYSSEVTYPLETPQWTFQEGSLKRWFQ